MQVPTRSQGFSLIELSIVLVILGLLTGGILAGQSLIHAAKLRKIGVDVTSYITATQSFRDRYQALPGDMRNATLFWGVAGADPAKCTNILTDTGPATATCNGDGNGRIVGKTYGVPNAGTGGESYRYWQHLQNAGLLAGNLTGTAGPTGNVLHIVPGTNVPAAGISQAGWYITYHSTGDDIPNNWRFSSTVIGPYEHFFALGNPWGTSIINLVGPSYGGNSSAALKPEDAWNIDMKLDDGKPAGGKIIGHSWGNCTTALDASDTSATYRVNQTLNLCNLIFRNLF